MSKSPNLTLPIIGGAALAFGLMFGLANRNYGGDRIDMLEDSLKSAKSDIASEGARATELETLVAELQDAAATASAGGSYSEPVADHEGGYGLGRAALAEEIAAWDIDVLPDGRGLPEGSGDVFTGEEVFAEKCAICHGDFAEGVDNWPKLAGGFDTLADKDPVKTVGSYWPYLSTVWDYVNRSMPFGEAQTLEPDEVYAIVAYILYSNDLVDDDFELSHENFTDVEMYNTGGFFIDDRAETEYAVWTGEPCMENCKPSVEITMRASVLDVTPEEEASGAAVVTEASAPVTEEAAAPAEETPAEDATADLIAQGEAVFRKCGSCHAVGDNARNKTGPVLNGVVGSAFGAAEGFRYSKVFKDANAEGRIWDEAELAAFLGDPRKYMPGTRMAYAGLRNEEDIVAVTEYLRSFSQ